MEQAQQISDLEDLYGDKWSNIYKELAAKKRLEDNFTSPYSKDVTPKKPKCTCKEGSLSNVCS